MKKNSGTNRSALAGNTSKNTHRGYQSQRNSTAI